MKKTESGKAYIALTASLLAVIIMISVISAFASADTVIDDSKAITNADTTVTDAALTTTEQAFQTTNPVDTGTAVTTGSIPQVDPYPNAETVSVIALESEYNIKSPYAALYDITDDCLIWSTDLYGRVYPASTTKVLTALYAMSVSELDKVYTVGDELDFVASDASVAGLKKKQKLTLEQLLYAMLLPSGNDAAYTVAAGCGATLCTTSDTPSPRESVDAFMTALNEYARSIGMKSTNFVTPDGYHDENHYTCLYDMLVLSKVALANSVMVTVTSTSEKEFRIVSGEKFKWSNSNKLLDSETSMYYEYAVGLKTGRTEAAGACLIAAAKRNGRTVVALVFGGSEKNDRFIDARAMLEYALDYTIA